MGRTAGLTLLELVIALAILGLVAAWLLEIRLHGIQHAREQRRHVDLTQLVRSEAEALRAGSRHVGSCLSLTTEQRNEGFACTVQESCAFPSAVCGAAPGLRALRIEATGPNGKSAVLGLVARADPNLWIEARR